MKTKWMLLLLLAVAAAIAFWFLGKPVDSSKLGIEAHALTGEILAHGPRPPGSDALDKVKAHLAKELEANGWITRLQELERDTSIGKIKFSNLRARIAVETTDTWERPVRGILCAHIDSKYFKDKEFLGADDAASACAAVVVIANHLALHQRGQAEQLELVFFDGEEAFDRSITTFDGLYGSRFYANQWRNSPAKPGFGILLDMVGHKDLAIRIPTDSPKHLADLMFSEAKDLGVARHFGTASGEIIDDHVPLNLVGIPTLDIIGDFSRKGWWHTTGDNAAIISAESLGISIGVVLGMLDELLETE